MIEILSTLPKEFWLSDGLCKACCNCSKGFTPVSRKMNCRYCGLVFCFKCIWENQKIGETKLEKICKKCLNSVKSHENTENLRKISLTGSFLSKNDSFEQDENIIDFVKELQSNIEENLENSIQEFSIQLSERLVSEFSLTPNWANLLKTTALKIVEVVCPSTKHRKDKMDINQYIKIFKVESKQDSCEFLQGSLVSKNFASKKMRSAMDRPKILFLDNKETSNFQILTISRVIFEDNEISELFVKKVISISPNVVITTSGLSEIIIQKLINNNISVIMNVKDKEFYHLARVTQAVALKSINEGCLFDRFLGKCKTMNIQEFENKSFICFKEIKDPSLGGSVVISGQESKRALKALKKMVSGLRNAKLEGVFMFECGSKIGKQDILTQFKDIIEVKIMQVSKNSVCHSLSSNNVAAYSSSDKCLGSYINSLFYLTEETCASCGIYLKEHISYFFFKEKVLKITVSKTKRINNYDYFISTFCSTCHAMVSPHYLSNATWEYSFYKFLWNFFSGSKALSKCGHLLFENDFKFQLDTTQILFQVQDFSNFSVFFKNTFQVNLEFYNELTKACLADVCTSGIIALKNLKNIALGVLDKSLNEVPHSETVNDNSISHYAISEIIEEINKIIHEFGKITNSQLSLYLQVESVRRTYFLIHAKIYSELEVIRKTQKKVTAMKKRSFISNHFLSLIDSIIQDQSSSSSEKKSETFNFNKGILTFPDTSFSYVPVFESDCGSMIAYCLSSFSYYLEVINLVGDDFKNNILKFEVNEWNFSVSSFDGMDVKEDLRRFYGEAYSLHMTAYFANQFHCIRMNKNITNEDFILSLSKTVFKEGDLGKSAALIKQSHDSQFILKVVEEKELKMFIGMATSYFSYLHKHFYAGNESVLCHCLGAYKVQLKCLNSGKSRSENIMVFEKIGIGIKRPYMVYDLKGTTNKRRKVKEGEKMTKMDLNFVEDFDNLPLPISKKNWEVLKNSISNDTEFLSKSNIVDYSMLLVINLEIREIALGIIDYNQQYTFDKVLENKYKLVVGSQVPTITDPESYKNRFCEKILNDYFIVVE